MMALVVTRLVWPAVTAETQESPMTAKEIDKFQSRRGSRVSERTECSYAHPYIQSKFIMTSERRPRRTGEPDREQQPNPIVPGKDTNKD
jgi:hypothetical protein